MRARLLTVMVCPCLDFRARIDRARFYRFTNRVMLLVALFSLPFIAAHADLSINSVQAAIVDEQLRALIDFELELGDAAEEALTNGIALTIAVDMQLTRERAWLPDASVSEWRKDFEIRFHSLSSHYVVSEFGRGKLVSFATLTEALKSIGDNRLMTVPVPTLPTNPGITYLLNVRARLDVEALPTPLRILGYIMPDWRISSRWTQWPVRS